MCDFRVLHLRFMGMDSWDRPVYKDDNGTLWKDVNPGAGTEPDLCTPVNNEPDGEPDTGMKCPEEYRGVTIVSEPERIVWQQEGGGRSGGEKISDTGRILR